MLWERARKSENIEDRRGVAIGGKKGLTIGGIAIIAITGWLSGHSPMQIVGNIVGQAVQQGGIQTSSGSSTLTNVNANSSDVQRQFSAAILGETEDVWQQIFANAGKNYQPTPLVLFSNTVQSACGGATSASGPFYCPGDRKVYIDLSFFKEMETKYRAAGDFAQAYVIAHEVGHHVQTLLGVSNMVNQARTRGQEVRGDNGLLVRQELQADCYAGVWAYHSQKRHDWLQAGDVDEALNAANAIGDDTLQKRATGVVVPDSFSHGTSAQRIRWFKTGFESGNPNSCDTFNAITL